MTITDTDLVAQVAQLRANLERQRLDPAVLWVTRTGRVRHLLHEALVGPGKPGQTLWTFCGIDLDGLTPATPDDTRSTCRKCDDARRERHNWLAVMEERDSERRRQRDEERRLLDEANDGSIERIDSSLASIKAGNALLKEHARHRRLLRREPERPERTLEETLEEVRKLRAENDRLEAEMIAAAS